MPRYQVGIDVGGTFTDFVILDLDERTLRLEKTLTTPRDLWEGIETGLQRAGVDLANATLAHGTTVGLNTLLQRAGAPTGLITTVGFRDAYEIGRGARPDMYNLFYRKPVPLVPREHRLEVRERLDADGSVVIPLTDDDVLAAAEHFRAHEIRDVAVCFLHAYRNPDHERRTAELLQEVYPEAVVSTSHELVREWREYERTSTTCINAYIRPRTGEYLARAIDSLAASGYRSAFFINQSSGGVISSGTARSRPVTTLLSGPAGGVAASATLGAATGFDDVIAFDMGGTSTDVAVVQGGRLRLTADSKIDGHPISVPAVDLHTIGAGGGSIARLDDVGALTVGPESAGAEPGPACYGRGGVMPTVTDANLVLGRVAPSQYIPGGLELDRTAAAEAIERHVGQPLGLAVEEAAAGIVEIVNLKMAMAVRAVTVQRGLDPKDFVLYAFGGAGPVHACWIARELGIPTVVVPVAPGQFSALGIAATDVRHDLVRTTLTRAGELTAARLAELLADAERDARSVLEAEGVAAADMELRRALDVRYAGQEYTITVPVTTAAFDDAALELVRSRFNELHEQTYSHSSPGEPIEVVNVRIEAIGRVRQVNPPAIPSGGESAPPAALVTRASTQFDRTGGAVDTDVWDRATLQAGNVVQGPAIIADTGATTVLPPGARCTVDTFGQLVIAF
ncbi:MAG: hydantoinase/oxoprolinase family protein [Gaiellales bacterium]